MGALCSNRGLPRQEPDVLCCRQWHRPAGNLTAVHQDHQVEAEPEPEGEVSALEDGPPSPPRATAAAEAFGFSSCTRCNPGVSSTAAETVEVTKEDPVYAGQYADRHWEGQGHLTVPGLYKYEGSFQQSKAHGQGVYKGEDGTTYEGQWCQDKKHGHGVFVHADGTVYVGSWQEDVKSGAGVETWVDGTRYKGEFFHGMRHGAGRYKSSRGKYEGQFRNDKMEGTGRYEFTSGRVYVGQWQDGIMLGQGMMEFPDGSKYEGNYERGVKSGFGMLSWPDGRRYRGQWVNGNQHGMGTMVNAAGVELSGEWHNGEFIASADVKAHTEPPRGDSRATKWGITASVRVFSTPGATAEPIGTKDAGAVVRGHCAGDWLALSDEPGFIQVSSQGVRLLKPVMSSPGAWGELKGGGPRAAGGSRSRVAERGVDGNQTEGITSQSPPFNGDAVTAEEARLA